MVKGGSRTLFVGGLSIYIGEEELYHYFSAFSKVLKVVFLKDRETGKSKGYAFVSLKDADVAFQLAGQTHFILGRQVECQVAAKKCEKSTNAIDRMRRKLYVTNIAPHLSDWAFRSYFSTFGEVHNCYIIQNPELKCNRNYGFVEFEDPAVTEYLLGLKSPLEIGGIRIYVHPFKDKDNVKHHVEAYTNPKASSSRLVFHENANATEHSPHSTDSQGDHHSSSGLKQARPAAKEEVAYRPQAGLTPKASTKRALKFTQKYPIKGEEKPNVEGSNYHLRIPRPSSSGFGAGLPLFQHEEGSFKVNRVELSRCGQCQFFFNHKIITRGSHLQLTPGSCSCQGGIPREFSLFLKDSSTGHRAVDRVRRVEPGEASFRVTMTLF